MEGDEKIRLNVDFPKRLYEALAREARLNGETIAGLARRGVLEEMDRVRLKRLERETAA